MEGLEYGAEVYLENLLQRRIIASNQKNCSTSARYCNELIPKWQVST